MATKFQSRPSEHLNIEHPVAAFYFDRAIYTFGSLLEADMEDEVGKVKDEKGQKRAAQRVLNRWMGEGQQRFASPQLGMVR